MELRYKKGNSYFLGASQNVYLCTILSVNKLLKTISIYWLNELQVIFRLCPIDKKSDSVSEIQISLLNSISLVYLVQIKQYMWSWTTKTVIRVFFYFLLLMYGLLGLDNIWPRYNYFQIQNLRAKETSKYWENRL